MDPIEPLFKPKSIAHLKEAGLCAGQIVVDVGSGNGDMTCHLADIVGSTGHVYAVDINDRFLNEIRSKGLQNVTAIQTDIESTDPLNDLVGKVDIVYVRCVLIHLKDPTIAIKNMRKLLKPGGKIVNQESMIDSTHCVPESIEINSLRDAVVDLGDKLGVNFNIGEGLVDLYCDSGFDNYNDVVSTDRFTFTISMNEIAPVLLAYLKELRPIMMALDILTVIEFTHYVSTVIQLGERDDISLVFDQRYIIVNN